MPVLGLEHAGRRAGGMVVAGLPRHLPVHQPARRLEVEHENLSCQQRRLHPLTLARTLALDQREENALRRENTSAQIGDGNARAHRALTGQARHRHDAAHALRDLVEARPLAIGPVLAEARNAGIDEARIDRAQRLVIDAEPVLHVGPVVLDHDVGLCHQLLEDGDALLRFEVERDGALVAVEILEIRRVACSALQRVLADRLDLDDVGAPIGELPHAGRPGPHAGKIDNLVGREGEVGHGLARHLLLKKSRLAPARRLPWAVVVQTFPYPRGNCFQSAFAGIVSAKERTLLQSIAGLNSGPFSPSTLFLAAIIRARRARTMGMSLEARNSLALSAMTPCATETA